MVNTKRKKQVNKTPVLEKGKQVKKVSKKFKKATVSHKAVKVKNTSISTATVSSNWINFMKSNNQNVTFKISSVETPKPRPARPKKERPVKPPKVVAIDCEMVSDENGDNLLARVSIVDFQLKCIYDNFVKPACPVGDYRTKVSGIRPIDIENGKPFETVQNEVRDLLRNKFLVGHALVHDLKVLKFGHHAKLIRDTSQYAPFRETSDGKTPALKKLSKQFLEEAIQEGEHSSIQDASAAMKLYKKFRHDWEKSLVEGRRKSENKEVSKNVNNDNITVVT